MRYKRRSKERSWGQILTKGVLAILLVVLGIDYGKHFILKRVLEDEITNSGGVVSFESLTVSFWPLFESHLILKEFHVNISGTPLTAMKVNIRQGWKDWRLAHIQATGVSSAEAITVQDAEGILDTTDLRTCVKVSQLTLRDIQAKLPLLSFSGPKASFDFFYEMTTQHLTLEADAPEMSFPNGVTFGLSGQGVIDTKNPVQGKMDVKIKNIDTMMKELVAVGVIDESQAGLITMGSNFLDKIGLHDITLPLKIDDGEVRLGPVILFKVKNNKSM